MRTKRIINACQAWYKKSTHYFYSRFLEPRSLREDDKRRERILTLILFVILLMTIAFEVGLIIQHFTLGENYRGVPVPIFTIFLAVYTGLYIATRKGYYVIASYIFITIFFAGAFYSSYMWGASMPMGLLAYGLIVTMASIVVSSRFGFIVAVVACAVIIVIGLREHAATTLPDWKLHAIKTSDVIGYSVMIGITALLSRLSNREMEKSLHRARTSELALKEERDNLETLVETRTKALRELERERMRELYRFAEFGKLSGGIFHDLLNPLTAVSLSVSKLSAVDTLLGNKDEVAKSIQTAVQATKRMEQFMGSIRKQIKSEDIRRHFLLNEEINDAIAIMAYKAGTMGVTINFETEEKISFSGNPLKFNQVITNLIANAIDAYDKDTGNTEERINGKRMVFIKLDSNEEYITCSVTDHGRGMSEETKNKIFTPFFTTKEKGLGLGLSTTKDIIEEHFGGTLICQSEIDEGTCFTITLPNRHDEPQTKKENTEEHTTGVAVPGN